MTIQRTIELSEKQDTVMLMALEVSRYDWNGFISILRKQAGDGYLNELSSIASQYSSLFAEISEYLDERGGNGCGDHGHDDAMIAAQKRVKKVRKALGYSYS